MINSLLTFNHVVLKIPQSAIPILHDINFFVDKTDFIIILGSNGSGKSSLLKLLYSAYLPSHGRVILNNKPIHHYKRQELADKIAVLTQDSSETLFPNLTIYENYLLVQKNRRLRCRQFLQTYLSDYNKQLMTKLDVPVSTLSGGEKQTLALAYCLINKPDILLLDEHTSALDPRTAKHIMRLTANKIKQHQLTCMMITHDLDVALNYGNRLLMLSNGKIHHIYDKRTTNVTKDDLLMHY